MGKRILILSSQNDYSELLRLSLEESEVYIVHFAQSVEEVLKKIQVEEFVLVILDAEATDQPIVSTGEAIHGQVPGLPLIVIPPQNNSEHPSLAGFEWDGFVSRPFFKPDLLELVNNLTQSFEEQKAQNQLAGESAAEEESELSLEEELELLLSGGGDDAKTPTQVSVSVPEEPPFTAAEQVLHDLQKQLDSQAVPEGEISLEDGEELSLEEELELLLGEGRSTPVEPTKEVGETLPPEKEVLEETHTPPEPSAQPSGSLTADEIANLFGETSQKEAQTQSEPDQISEEDISPEDVHESVMSQLDSQTVIQDDKDLSSLLEKELSETPPELEETAVISLVDETSEVSLPDSLIAGPATKLEDDMLEGVLSQSASQSIPDLEDEFEQLSAELEHSEDAIAADEDTGSPAGIDIAGEPGSGVDDTPEIPVPHMETQTVPDQEQEGAQALPDKTEPAIESELDQLLSEEDTPTDVATAPDSVLQTILAQLEKQEIPQSEEDTLQMSEDELMGLEAEESTFESEVLGGEIEEGLETEASEEITDTFQEVLDQVGAGSDLGDDDTQDIQELPEHLISELPQDTADTKEPALEQDTEELFEPEPSQQLEKYLEEAPEAEEVLESVISQLDSQTVDRPDDELSEMLEEELSQIIVEGVPAGEEVHASIEDKKHGEIETTDTLRNALSDNNSQLAAQNLSILMRERSAHAASITRSGAIWAHSGVLSLLDIQEIENVLMQGQRDNDKIDLARFIKLGDEQNKYLLYATTIRENVALCMIYESTKRLSRIRSATIELARSLAKRKLDVPFIPTPTVEEPKVATPQESGAGFDRKKDDATQKTLDELLVEMPPSVSELKPGSTVQERVQGIPESEPELEETTEIGPSISPEIDTEDELLELLEAEFEDIPEPEPVTAAETEPIISAEDELEPWAMEQPETGEIEPEIVIAEESEAPLEIEYADDMDVEETASERQPEPGYKVTQKTGYGWFTNKAHPFNKDKLIQIESDFKRRQIQFTNTEPTSRMPIVPILLDEESSDIMEQITPPQKEIRSEKEDIRIETGAHLINQLEPPDKDQLFQFQKKFQHGISRLNLGTQKEKSMQAMEPVAEKYVPIEFPTSETTSVEQALLKDQDFPAPSHPESEAIAETPGIVQEAIETITLEQDDETETQPVRPFTEEDIPPPDPFVLDFDILEEEVPVGEIDKTEDRAETILEESETLEHDQELDDRLQNLISGLETKPTVEETDDFKTVVDAAILKEDEAEEQQDSQALLEKAAAEYFKKMPAEDIDDDVLFLDENFDILSLGQKPEDILSTPFESEPEKMLDFFLSEAAPLENGDEFIEQDVDAPPTGIEDLEPSKSEILGLEEPIPDADQLPEQPDEGESVDEDVITTLHGILSKLEAEVDIESQQADARTDTVDIKPIESIDTDTTLIADTIEPIKLDDPIHEAAVDEAAPEIENHLESITAKTELTPTAADEGSILSQLSRGQPPLDDTTLHKEHVKPDETQVPIPDESPEQEDKEQKINLEEDLFRMLIELNEDQGEQAEKTEPSETSHADIAEEIDLQSKQDAEDAQSVIIDVLSQMGESETDDESPKTDQIVEKLIITEPTEPDEHSIPLTLGTPIPPKLDEELDQLITEERPEVRQTPPSEKPSIEPNQAMLLDDNLLPWEKEEFDSQSDQEITPTISASLEEESAQDVLLEMLAENQTDPIILSPQFTTYTCILIPELSEYRLNSKIARRLKLWVPQLCMAFGWQLENLFIQPTYMQWTVRVPPNTSQGMIVRKIRQRTSYRLFYEFPDLIGLSQTVNFWAKGYLVVSGNEPPTPEYLDDFIRKNRRSKGFTKP